MKTENFYKLAQPDGWDFYTGNTINYREGIGKTVKCPRFNENGELCSEAYLHASRGPDQCFVGAKIPCSAYLVAGMPIKEDHDKCGFSELFIKEELLPEKLFQWDYKEACNPVHSFKVKPPKVDNKILDVLGKWASVGASVRASVRASVWDSVWAYIGGLFPNIKTWKFAEKLGENPWEPLTELWYAGYVPSFDGKIWRLHACPKARIVHEFTP